MTDVLEFPDVLQENRGSMNAGRLRLQKSNIVFKNLKTGKVDQYVPADIDKVFWLIRARGNCLKVLMKNGNIHRYDGLKESDYEKTAAFLLNIYQKTLEKKDVATKGWNWGLAKFTGNALEFEVDNNLAFEIPLSNVSHGTTNKNEVTIEFHQNDDAVVSLMELRFHIPSSNANEADPAEEFFQKIVPSASIIQAVGDAIAVFQDVSCLTPRGRYDLKLYPTFIQLHGKTFDYKIPLSSVLRMFLLPQNERQMYFVLSLDPPIKQGQTRYHFLVLVFEKETEMSLELNIADEELKQKYGDRLSKEMSGTEYEVISRVMKGVLNMKITVPGAFKSTDDQQYLPCSYKAGTGLLYPLERGFIFLHKPAMHIRFDEIAGVHFARSQSSLRSFDFDIESNAGTTFTFVGIPKGDYARLFDFVSQKKLRVKNIGGKLVRDPLFVKLAKDEPGGGKGADDMAGSDEEAGHDVYLERMKEEGKDKNYERQADDDDESSDEDFELPDNYDSEVAEEWDTDAASSSEAESGEEHHGEKEKKHKKARTITVPEPELDGGGDDDDGMDKKERKKLKKKEKKEKDPNKPKRPPTAYLLWMSENRDDLKEQFPGLSITDLSKKGGELWKELSVSEKEKYEAEVKKKKEEYVKAMAEYNKQGASSSKGDAGKKGKKAKAASAAKSSSGAAGGGGAGSGFKSKEFVSDGDSDSDSDKPLKKKSKDDDSDADVKSEGSADEGGSDAGSDDD